MFLRCVDHKIIIMPLPPTVILFIDTDITARNNRDKYCNTEIIFSRQDLLFFSFCILHCSVYIIVVYKLKYQARKNFSFQNIIKNQPSFCCNFWRWFNSYCNLWRWRRYFNSILYFTSLAKFNEINIATIERKEGQCLMPRTSSRH